MNIREHIELLIKDVERYRWLRKQYAKGKETDLAEHILSEKELDEYIDSKKKRNQFSNK